MTAHDTWRDTETTCSDCGRYLEDPDHDEWHYNRRMPVVDLLTRSVNQTNRSQYVNAQASINGARWLIKRLSGDTARLTQMADAAQQWLERSDWSNIGNRPYSD